MLGKSFKSRIVIPALIVLIILTVALTSYVTAEFLSYSDFLIREKIIANTNSLKLHINNSEKHSRAAAVSMANNPEVVKAVKNRDREEILRIFTSMCDVYQVSYFTITDDQGTVLVRTYSPDHFGDSLLKQQNIKDALNGTISTYFEEGTAIMVSIRTGAPIYDSDKTLVGTISAGIRFDTDDAVDELKERLHAEVALFFGDTKICTTIRRNGERIIGTKIDPQVAKIVIDGKKEFSGNADILGETYKTFYMPLLDSNNETFATLFIGSPMSELKAESNAMIRNIFVISFIGLLIASGILYGVIASISEPLLMLSKEMDNIANGNLSIVIDVKNDDEIGYAGKALQKVADIIHELIDDINIAISEHEQGNTEYRIDTSDFLGAYRLLADRIIELSSLGMRDQLTGLPNRRSFDSRLDLEWNRAKREKTPFSILMIDVDHFKTYNDTYGHQQGDLVLQTVAKVLPMPIRRPVDFAARWGGEEFAVLLPSTDLDGALHVAEKIRIEVEKAEIPSIGGGTAKKVTISIGVNTQTPTQEDSLTDLIAQADEALYRAKETGRNKVCPY